MVGGEENGMLKGTRRSSVWERRKVDFVLLVSRRQAWATWEPSRGRKWPIPRPQCVHTLHLLGGLKIDPPGSTHQCQYLMLR